MTGIIVTPKPLSEMPFEELRQFFLIILSEHDPAGKDFYAAEKIRDTMKQYRLPDVLFAIG